MPLQVALTVHAALLAYQSIAHNCLTAIGIITRCCIQPEHSFSLQHCLVRLLQVALTVHVAMTAYQSVIYDWVKATGTLRLYPFDPRIGKSHRHNFAPLNYKSMELRKVCNHPALSYPPDYGEDQGGLLRQCGKLWHLDGLLIKLVRTGQSVLLFSTMTRRLNLLEGYLRLHRFGSEGIEGIEATQYARTDGGTRQVGSQILRSCQSFFFQEARAENNTGTRNQSYQLSYLAGRLPSSASMPQAAMFSSSC